MVPRHILVALLVLLAGQIALAQWRATPEADIRELPASPPVAYLKLLGLADDAFMSRLVVLWLQTHDYQQGVSLSYREIDYSRLVDWLETSLRLDERNQYPLLLATRVYGVVGDPTRQRLMLQWVAGEFEKRPVQRWRWLAHAVFVARHRLDDEALALEYARLLANTTEPDQVPDWARQMHIFILADMGEVEAARVLLGGLLESGELDDGNEYRFLLQRIENAQARNTTD